MGSTKYVKGIGIVKRKTQVARISNSPRIHTSCQLPTTDSTTDRCTLCKYQTLSRPSQSSKPLHQTLLPWPHGSAHFICCRFRLLRFVFLFRRAVL